MRFESATVKRVRGVRMVPAILCAACVAALPRGAAAADNPADVQTAALSPGATPATPAPRPTETAPAYPLTGDWLGLRTNLADKGYTFGGYIYLDGARNLTGGLRHDKSVFHYLLDLNATVDTEKAFGWKGGTIFGEFQNFEGRSVSPDLVGDAQGVNNADAAHYSQIYQLWVQQMLAGDTVRIKLGKIDSNADFSSVDHGKDFLNSSMAYSPTIMTMVTYPDPAPGGEIFFSPDGHWYAGVGAFYSNAHQTVLDISGHPEAIEPAQGGAFLIGEAGCRWALGKDALPGHAAVGGWGHTGKFTTLDGGRTEGTAGYYAFGDQSLFHEAPEGGTTRDVGLFLQYGWADGNVSSIGQHVGGGVSLAGFVPGRPDDTFGCGATWVRLGDVPGTLYGSETAVEAYYKLQITKWLNVKPDVQYVRHPGGMDVGDAVVVSVRAEVDF